MTKSSAPSRQTCAVDQDRFPSALIIGGSFKDRDAGALLCGNELFGPSGTNDLLSTESIDIIANDAWGYCRSRFKM
jgi:hypothetical protein